MLLIIIFTILLSYSQAEKHIFIKDYYQWNKVKDVILFDCKTDREHVKMTKYFSSFNLCTSYYTITESPNYTVPIFQENFHNIGVTIDVDCKNSFEFLKYLSNNIDYPHKFIFKWIFIGNSLNNSLIQISTLNINVDAEITFAEVKNESYRLYEVYNTGKKHNGHIVVDYSGYWNNVSNLKLHQKPYKYVRRSNLTGIVLKCMVVVRNKGKQSLRDYLLSTNNTHLDSMHRFNYVLLLHLRDMYNFRYYTLRTLSWGYKRNNTFDGMIGELEKKNIDIGGSPVFFRLERAEVVDYTMQTWTSSACFIFRHPKRASSVFKIYVRPFTIEVWYLAVTVICVVILLGVMMSKIQKRIDPCMENISYSEIILLILAAIFQQGVTSNFIMTSGKIIIFSVFTFSLLFYQFYSASIVSSLLMEPPKTIRTLQNLLDSNLQAGIEDILYTIDYFRRTNDRVSLEIYRKKIYNEKYNNLFSPEEGLKLVKKGGFAFHADTATAYKIMTDTFSEKQICELSEINLFPQQKMMSVVQKGSPFRKLMQYGLIKLAERGITARQRLLWHAKKPICVRRLDPTKFKVTIMEFSPILTYLACGMILSLLFLLVEICIKKTNEKDLHILPSLWKEK